MELPDPGQESVEDTSVNVNRGVATPGDELENISFTSSKKKIEIEEEKSLTPPDVQSKNFYELAGSFYLTFSDEYEEIKQQLDDYFEGEEIPVHFDESQKLYSGYYFSESSFILFALTMWKTEDTELWGIYGKRQSGDGLLLGSIFKSLYDSLEDELDIKEEKNSLPDQLTPQVNFDTDPNFFTDLFKNLNEAKDSTVLDDLMTLHFYCELQKKKNGTFTKLVQHIDYVFEKVKAVLKTRKANYGIISIIAEVLKHLIELKPKNIDEELLSLLLGVADFWKNEQKIYTTTMIPNNIQRCLLFSQCNLSDKIVKQIQNLNNTSFSNALKVRQISKIRVDQWTVDDLSMYLSCFYNHSSMKKDIKVLVTKKIDGVQFLKGNFKKLNLKNVDELNKRLEKIKLEQKIDSDNDSGEEEFSNISPQI